MPIDPPPETTQLAAWVIMGLITLLGLLGIVIKHLYNKIGAIHDSYGVKLADVSGANQDKLEKLIAEFVEQSTMMVERMRENNEVLKRNSDLYSSVAAAIHGCADRHGDK